MKKIFIGGTGRSGTTILAKLLGTHSELYTFPKEIRFITDPDGIGSLRNAIVSDWSPFNADIAIDRFILLMKKVSGLSYKSYPLLDLNKYSHRNFIKIWTDNFVNDLCEYHYKGAWAKRATILNKGLLKYLGHTKLTNLLLDKCYYGQPMTIESFNKLINKHLNLFFETFVEKEQKKGFVEHTPTNINHIEMLLGFFPDLKFVHVYRDPRDIISSYSKQDWGSGLVENNLVWINDVLRQWQNVKQGIPKNRYFEIKFENLIYNRNETLNKLCNFIEIPFEEHFMEFDLSKHHIGRWQKNLNNEDIQIVNSKYSNLLTEYI